MDQFLRSETVRVLSTAPSCNNTETAAAQQPQAANSAVWLAGRCGRLPKSCALLSPLLSANISVLPGHKKLLREI
jgi:hypothetical protein